MQFTKRMWITMLAAVLLVAGGLSYFAVAADVEPYYVVTPKTCPNCRKETLQEDVHQYTTGPTGSGVHRGDGYTCTYQYVTHACADECSSCGYVSTNYTFKTYYQNHSKAGHSNGYTLD